MDHKHLDIEELFDITSEEGKELPENASDCESCNNSIKKTRFLLDELSKKNNTPVDELYKDLSSKVKTDDEIFNFLSESKLAKEEENEKVVQIYSKVKSKKKFYILTAAGFAAAASIMLVVNFFYYVLPVGKLISSSKEVNINRKGLFFGSLNLSTKTIVPDKDSIILPKEETRVETGRSVTLLAKSGGSLKFKEDADSFSVKIEEGECLIKFDKNFAGKREVELPLNNKVIITGTEIFFNVADKRSRIMMLEGKAKLTTSSKEIVELENGNQYTIAEQKLISRDNIKPEEIEELKIKFKESRGFAIGKNGPFEQNPGATLKDLKRKHGQLAVITLKNGTKHIGAFHSEGEELVIITTSGKVKVSSSDIKTISPYKVK